MTPRDLCRLVADADMTIHADGPDLLAHAMRACDHHRDGPQARADMRADIEATPPHLRADLLEHFRTSTPNRPAP